MTPVTPHLRDLSTPQALEKADPGLLERIALALEALAGQIRPQIPDWSAPAYSWDARSRTLRAATAFQPLDLDLLKGIEAQREILERNTLQFAQGVSANNALLWGTRGTGKSSLVKAAFHDIRNRVNKNFHLIEIHKEDLADLTEVIDLLAAAAERRFIVFIDDLSFEQADATYKTLKSALEGGVNGQPSNVLIYATSNRRHLMPRDASENQPLHPAETAEEHISLSDRFGLWLGFYPCDQDTYLAMVGAYAAKLGIEIGAEDLRRLALEWSRTRGARSGRVAWQFIRDLAGQKGLPTS